MRRDLGHLPSSKQRQIERTVEILLEEFDKAVAGAQQSWRKDAKILKIILFGSFARGGWTEDRATGYISDFDLLVIVNHERLTEIVDYWESAEDRLARDKSIKHPITLAVHTLEDVNRQISEGRYFFTDIRTEGVLLYELHNRELAQPGALTAQDAFRMGTEYFDRMVYSADRKFETYSFEMGKAAGADAWLNDAAFTLHQAVERLYGCFILTRTLYLPKTHNIATLRSLSENLDQRLIDVWPRFHRRDRRLYELLRRAYVEARYSEQYKITPDELRALEAGGKKLGDAVRLVCREWLDQLEERWSVAP